MPLFSVALEKILNVLLFQDRSLQMARQRLVGKVLKIELNGFASPVILLFSEQQIDVLGEWEGASDCTLSLGLTTLAKLRDRQRIPELLRSGELTLQGDINIVQHLVALIERIEWDPAEWIAPYVGDIAAEGIAQQIEQGITQIRAYFSRQHDYLGERITEEWRLAPSKLEVMSFSSEVDTLVQQLNALVSRLEKLESAS